MLKILKKQMLDKCGLLAFGCKGLADGELRDLTSHLWLCLQANHFLTKLQLAHLYNEMIGPYNSVCGSKLDH